MKELHRLWSFFYFFFSKRLVYFNSFLYVYYVMISNPQTPFVMSYSPSISNYSELGQYVNSTPICRAASEKSGRAVRRIERRVRVVRQPWNVEFSQFQLRGGDGTMREVDGWVVSREGVVKRFVNYEGVLRFVSQNQ